MDARCCYVYFFYFLFIFHSVVIFVIDSTLIELVLLTIELTASLKLFYLIIVWDAFWLSFCA